MPGGGVVHWLLLLCCPQYRGLSVYLIAFRTWPANALWFICALTAILRMLCMCASMAIAIIATGSSCSALAASASLPNIAARCLAHERAASLYVDSILSLLSPR